MTDINDLLSNSSDGNEEVVNLNNNSEQQAESVSGNISARATEKRMRDSDEQDELVEDGFTTVGKRPKRLNRNLSKNSCQDDIIQEGSKVYMTSKTNLPKQMGLAKLLQSMDIQKVLSIKYKGPFKVLITLENNEEAKKLFTNEKLADLDIICRMTDQSTYSFGIVKNIDVDVNEEEMKEKFECEEEIISMKRLKRLDEERKWVDSESIRMCFRSPSLPPYVYAYGIRFKVEPFTFPVTQCSGCWKFGHLRNQCPTKKIKCPKCGKGHDNCDTKIFTCLNCKEPHMAMDKSCAIFIKEKRIRAIMSQNNCTYRKALEHYLEQQSRLDVSQQNNSSKLVDNFNTHSQGGNLPRTYSSVVRAEAVVHEAPQDLSSEDNVTESESQDNTKISDHAKRTNIRRKRKPKNSSYRNSILEGVERVEETDRVGVENNNKTHKAFRSRQLIKKIITRAKEIIFEKKSLEEKVYGILTLIVTELSMFLVNMCKDGDFMSCVFSLFNNG